ncbi:LysR substrate-binding domain-containing protein [Vibrio tritonius]|uniref:LysR substrate-binding domain-containing protein n=1 Tax=Vibrio tritonius TaxID=1435069 RepID=UPI000837B7D4|nr:LysR substrate-binding domain-containing protein [Vibrio tritonius]
MINSQEVAFFITIASSSSLAAAARKMNVTPPSVSQRLQHIEQKLGVTLVERSARSIALTAEGKLLATRGKTLLAGFDALYDDLAHHKESLSGKLRIDGPFGLGMKHVGLIIGEFQQRYPELEIELNLSESPRWDPINSPDILLYIGHLKDSSLRRVVLVKNRRLLLAAPHYLASAPPLNHPEDLTNHRCIALRENQEDATLWRFTHHATGEESNIRIRPCLASNVGHIIREWAVQGLGIIQRSYWDVTEELRQGSLVELLPEYQFASADIVALLANEEKLRPQKVNLFLDYLKSRLPQLITEGPL